MEFAWIATAALMLAYCSLTQAWAADAVSTEAAKASDSSSEVRPFVVTVDSTFASKYMMDGFKIGGDHAVWQPSIALTTPIDGVSLFLWSAFQIDRENQQYDELDFMARYAHDFFRYTDWAFNLHGYYDYWVYPKINVATPTVDAPDSSQNMHGNKLNAGVSMTRLLPLWGSYVVPTYNVYYWLYWAQNQENQFQGGAHHELALQYYRDIPKILSGPGQPYFGVSGSGNYNGGAFGTQPGWSHAIAQVATGVYGTSWNLSLSFNRQWSYIASVDPSDEIWSTVSFTKQF